MKSVLVNFHYGVGVGGGVGGGCGDGDGGDSCDAPYTLGKIVWTYLLLINIIYIM